MSLVWQCGIGPKHNSVSVETLGVGFMHVADSISFLGMAPASRARWSPQTTSSIRSARRTTAWDSYNLCALRRRGDLRDVWLT